MKCPNCGSHEKALVKVCRSCGGAFASQDLLELNQLEYLVAETAQWEGTESRRSPYIERLDMLRERLQRASVDIAPKAARPLSPYAPTPVEKKPKPTPVPEPEPAPAPAKPAPAPAEPAVAAAKPAMAHAPHAPVAVPKPAPVPKPKRPPIQWGKIWEKAVELMISGALLRGLLYLGAFMIVVSATILVVRFWGDFPEALQLVFIAAVPSVFYLIGWLVRSRLQLPQAGGVLTGIGALLVAVDFAAVYQFGGLADRLNGNAYWLGASIFCTIIYGLNAWRLPGEFFYYITLISGGNVVLALTRLIGLPIEWSVAATTATGTGMTFLARWLVRVGGTSRDLARASRYLPQIIIPVSLATVLFVPGDATFGQIGAFLFAAIGYGVLAWSFPAAIFAHATVWSTIGAAIFIFQGVDLPWEWYATAVGMLAIPYLLVSVWMAGRFSDENPYRRGYLAAINIGGFGLVSIAILGGFVSLFFEIWAGVAALALASLILAGCAYLFRRPLFVLVSGGLFILAFSPAVARLLLDTQAEQWITWLMSAWVGLALGYLGLSVSLRRAENYARWLFLWAHLLTPSACFGLLLSNNVGVDSRPTLVALGGAILVYIVSAILHDSGRHPALSSPLKRFLPSSVSQSIFLWPVGILIPFWGAAAWMGSELVPGWLGAVMAGFALAYVGLGQVLVHRRAGYRFPFHVYAYLLILTGVIVAWEHPLALLTTLYIDVAVLAALAFVHKRETETTLAALLFIWPFHLSLDNSQLVLHGYTLAYILLAGLGYIPLGILLKQRNGPPTKPEYGRPVTLIGYCMSICAVAGSLLGRFDLYLENVPWVGVAVPLIAASLYVFSVYHFRERTDYGKIFSWAVALTLSITFGQTLTLLRIPPEYDAVAWVGLAFAYLLGEPVFAQAKEKSWLQAFRLPMGVGAAALCALGLALTIIPTLSAFSGGDMATTFPPILAQTLAVGLVILAANLYRSRWPLYLEPPLVFLPVTLFFIGYGERIFGQVLTSPQYGIVWSALGLIHLVAAALLDRTKIRYAHGVYLGSYALALFAILWALGDQGALLWTLGLGIAVAVISALLVHFNRHHSWDELIHYLYEEKESIQRSVVHGAFLWFVAWATPVWWMLLLRNLNVVEGFQWLGFGLTSMAFVGIALWLRQLNQTYAWPFYTAAQFYVALGLLISIPFTARALSGQLLLPDERLAGIAFILLQGVAVVFYASSAWVFRKWDFYYPFTYLAAALTFFPYTLGWIFYGPNLIWTQISWPWMAWAIVLLGVGYLMDRKQPPQRVRFAHGPYLTGYTLAGLALIWSVSDRLVNLYTLAFSIGLAVVSHILVHWEEHHAYNDLLGLFWRAPGTVAYRAVRAGFLFFAVYAFPVWLAQLLTYHEVPLAWLGLALALVAPIYIALGLALRRVKAEYTWPLYSAGYALTAIGAIVAFDDLVLAIYVLALNTVVYAVSAYIFQQAFWLYLSNGLIPVVVLLTLFHNGQLNAPWVSGIFMGLAILYFTIGQWFSKRAGRGSALFHVSSFALPFYAPGYLLSAVALVVASSEVYLAISIYSAGVVLYALSAWAFRQSLFLYPAAWLAAVPYYLGMTLLLPGESQWYGLGWLPLIVVYIIIGRFGFHKKPLAAPLLTQPCMPFYLLAYALSLIMMALSYPDPLVFTLSLAAGAAVYLTSAALFRRPEWLYPGLGTAHLALLTYFTIEPSVFPARYITLPFLGMTWLMALMGYVFGRFIPAKDGPPIKGQSFIWNLVIPSWAQPFLIFLTFDLLIWQVVALKGFDTTIILAASNALLLGCFAMLWMDAALAYGAISFFVLTLGTQLRWMALPLPVISAWFGGIGFGLYLPAKLIERIVGSALPKLSPFAVWIKPLTRAAIALTAVAVVVTLPTTLAYTTTAAAALAFAGALYLAIAYQQRYYWLGYLGMGMLQVAWVLALIMRDVDQPQWYAIPAGLYFTVMGYLERGKGRELFATIIEGFGLAVLLVTSFIQSLNGAEGFPYFVLLLVEGVMVIWWGAARRLKVPFFVGLGASALNVVAQVVVLVRVYEINRWFIILGVGLALVTVAVFVERQRERIVAQAQGWRQTLDDWE